jgi:alkanesulfonate monooxygenase SsuD/methylene tetrahydromethanopterin reductase-like flavin-dependent oxidoreductase (luciferase family)
VEHLEHAVALAREAGGVRSSLDAAGRDRGDLYRSTQALVFLGPDGKKTADDFAKVRPAIGGTSEQLVETIGRWAEAGLDELIVPSFTLGTGQQAEDAIDQLIEEVAPAFR